jgi:putative transposase
MPTEARAVALRPAADNPRCGHRRISGEPARPGFRVSPTTIRRLLARARLDPAPQLRSSCAQAASIVACDFFTVETRSYAARTHCSSSRMQPARLARRLRDQPHPSPVHPRDRDSKHSGTFDEVFRAGGIRIVQMPVRAPKANTIAERLV